MGNNQSSSTPSKLYKKSLKKKLKNARQKEKESLKINNYNLTELPTEQFYGLHRLQSLDLSENCLREIPFQIRNLVELRYFNVSYNNLATLPCDGLTPLRYLVEINLSFNLMEEFPYEVLNAKSLRTLNLCDNAIKNISTNICQLRSLRTFVFNNNKVTVIPDTIMQLKELQVLECFNNPMVSPPYDVTSMGVETIKTYFNNIKLMSLLSLKEDEGETKIELQSSPKITSRSSFTFTTNGSLKNSAFDNSNVAITRSNSCIESASCSALIDEKCLQGFSASLNNSSSSIRSTTDIIILTEDFEKSHNESKSSNQDIFPFVKKTSLVNTNHVVDVISLKTRSPSGSLRMKAASFSGSPTSWRSNKSEMSEYNHNTFNCTIDDKHEIKTRSPNIASSNNIANNITITDCNNGSNSNNNTHHHQLDAINDESSLNKSKSEIFESSRDDLTKDLKTENLSVSSLTLSSNSTQVGNYKSTLTYRRSLTSNVSSGHVTKNNINSLSHSHSLHSNSLHNNSSFKNPPHRYKNLIDRPQQSVPNTEDTFGDGNYNLKYSFGQNRINAKSQNFNLNSKHGSYTGSNQSTQKRHSYSHNLTQSSSKYVPSDIDNGYTANTTNNNDHDKFTSPTPTTTTANDNNDCFYNYDNDNDSNNEINDNSSDNANNHNHNHQNNYINNQANDLILCDSSNASFEYLPVQMKVSHKNLNKHRSSSLGSTDGRLSSLARDLLGAENDNISEQNQYNNLNTYQGTFLDNRYRSLSLSLKPDGFINEEVPHGRRRNGLFHRNSDSSYSYHNANTHHNAAALVNFNARRSPPSPNRPRQPRRATFPLKSGHGHISTPTSCLSSPLSSPPSPIRTANNRMPIELEITDQSPPGFSPRSYLTHRHSMKEHTRSHSRQSFCNNESDNDIASTNINYNYNNSNSSNRGIKIKESNNAIKNNSDLKRKEALFQRQLSYQNFAPQPHQYHRSRSGRLTPSRPNFSVDRSLRSLSSNNIFDSRDVQNSPLTEDKFHNFQGLNSLDE
eukprot:Awhi_evm1s12801